MPTDIFPELARSGAQTMRLALGRRGGAALRAADLQALLRHSRVVVDFIGHFRRDASAALLEAGLEAAHFRRSCALLAETLDLFLSEVPDLRAMAEQLPDGAERAGSLEELSNLEVEARDARPSFGVWLAALDRPFPAVDDDRLRKGMAEAAAGEGEDVGAILASLRAGDDF